MRAALLFISLGLIVGVSHGQTVYNYDNPDFRSRPGYLHVTRDSSVFLTGMSSNDFMYGSAGVYRSTFNENHQIQFTDRLEGFWGEYPEEMSIHGLNNGDFIISARLTGCDYGQPLTVGVFDQYGIPYFEPFDVALNYYVKPKISLLGFGIGSEDTVIAISDPGNTLLMTYGGTSVLMVDEILAYDAQIHLDSGFLSAKDNVIELQDHKFNTILTREFQDDITAIDTIAEGYVVFADSIFVLDKNMSPISSRLPDSSYSFMVATSGHIWMFQERGYIAQFGYDLAQDTTYTLPFPSIISDVKHIGDIIHIAGQYTTDYELSRFHVKTDAGAFLEGELPDVSLVDIRIADTVRTRPRPWGPVNFLDIDYGRVYVTLYNAGNIEIDNVDVKMRQPHCPSICSGAYELTYTLEGLSLEPGQTREYFLDDLSFQCAAFQPEELCMWVVAPNRMPDINPVDSPICGQVDFITGTPPVLLNADIEIHPNPSRGDVVIETDLHLASYEVINTTGQSVASGDFQNSPHRINLSHLQSGTYMIIIEDGKRNYATKRIVLMQ